MDERYHCNAMHHDCEVAQGPPERDVDGATATSWNHIGSRSLVLSVRFERRRAHLRVVCKLLAVT
jgi:hypothetical protein